MFKKIEKDCVYYGFPVVLMTTKDMTTKIDNVTPISSTWSLGQSMVVGVGLDNQGYLNLKTGSDATFNIVDRNSWTKVEAIAKTTGNPNMPSYKKKAGYSFCADKFHLGKFTKLAGKDVNTVRIKECPIQIETEVINILSREEIAIVECKIKNIFVEENILHDDSHIEVDKWNPLIYKFREYTSTTQALGKNFRFQEYKSTQ